MEFEGFTKFKVGGKSSWKSVHMANDDISAGEKKVAKTCFHKANNDESTGEK